MHLFTMYAFTAGPHELSKIASIYKNNVRDSYALKDSDLQMMKFNIKLLDGSLSIKNELSNKKDAAQ